MTGNLEEMLSAINAVGCTSSKFPDIVCVPSLYVFLLTDFLSVPPQDRRRRRE